MTKTDLLAIVSDPPDGPVDTDQVIRSLYLRAKLERAEKAVEEGRLVDHEEVVRRSQTWSE